MTIDTFIDSYNSQKLWHIKRYNSGHYYVKQTIGDYSSKWVRFTISQVLDLF